MADPKKEYVVRLRQTVIEETETRVYAASEEEAKQLALQATVSGEIEVEWEYLDMIPDSLYVVDAELTQEQQAHDLYEKYGDERLRTTM